MNFNELKPILQIGKNGLTEHVLKEIELTLKKRKTIKLKMLKSFVQDRDRKELAKDIAMKTGSKLEQVVGFTFVLHKP